MGNFDEQNWGIPVSAVKTDGWIDIRGSVSHADKRIVMTAELTPLLPGLEWAAYDVLLHKKHWGFKDTDRQESPLIS